MRALHRNLDVREGRRRYVLRRHWKGADKMLDRVSYSFEPLLLSWLPDLEDSRRACSPSLTGLGCLMEGGECRVDFSRWSVKA